MMKCVIFRIHAIAKTLIDQVVIDIEGCDKHEIEAFVKGFNLICLKTNFRKFSISRSFKNRFFLTYMYNAILELNLQHLILRDRTY